MNAFPCSLLQAVQSHDPATPVMTVIEGGETVTFGDLVGMVERQRRALADLGVRSGDPIGAALPSGPGLAALILACWQSGVGLTIVDPRRIASLVRYEPAPKFVVAGQTGAAERGIRRVTIDEIEHSARPWVRSEPIDDPANASLSVVLDGVVETIGATALLRSVANCRALHPFARGETFVSGSPASTLDGLFISLILPLALGLHVILTQTAIASADGLNGALFQDALARAEWCELPGADWVILARRDAPLSIPASIRGLLCGSYMSAGDALLVEASLGRPVSRGFGMSEVGLWAIELGVGREATREDGRHVGPAGPIPAGIAGRGANPNARRGVKREISSDFGGDVGSSTRLGGGVDAGHDDELEIDLDTRHDAAGVVGPVRVGAEGVVRHATENMSSGFSSPGVAVADDERDSERGVRSDPQRNSGGPGGIVGVDTGHHVGRASGSRSGLFVAGLRPLRSPLRLAGADAGSRTGEIVLSPAIGEEGKVRTGMVGWIGFGGSVEVAGALSDIVVRGGIALLLSDWDRRLSARDGVVASRTFREFGALPAEKAICVCVSTTGPVEPQGADAAAPVPDRMVVLSPAECPTLPGVGVLRLITSGQGARATLAAVTGRRFRRSPAYDEAGLAAAVERALLRDEVLDFLMLWGCGKRRWTAGPDRSAIDALRDLLAAAEAAAPLRARVHIVCTDGHAANNGHSVSHYSAYFEAVEALAKGLDARFELESSVWRRGGLTQEHVSALEREPDFQARWERFPLRSRFIEQAGRHSAQIDPVGAARHYYATCLLEREVMKSLFARSVFLTYNGPEFNACFPDLPTLYIYPGPRGRTDKPWFVDAAVDHDGAAPGRRLGATVGAA